MRLASSTDFLLVLITSLSSCNGRAPLPGELSGLSRYRPTSLVSPRELPLYFLMGTADRGSGDMPTSRLIVPELRTAFAAWTLPGVAEAGLSAVCLLDSSCGSLPSDLRRRLPGRWSRPLWVRFSWRTARRDSL